MTDEQFNALAPFEHNYETALKANYSRYPGRAAIDTMFAIFREITGSRININRSCSTCVLNLVKSVGKLYFEEKERRQKAEEEAAKVAAAKTEPEPNPDKAKKSTRKKQASNEEGA